jgi:hypothetical protein
MIPIVRREPCYENSVSIQYGFVEDESRPDPTVHNDPMGSLKVSNMRYLREFCAVIR